ncbi:MAG: POTRA domain-containing protein, partial [Rhabdochlamydiaceae bacterium]
MDKKYLVHFFIFSLIATELAAIPPPVPSAGVVERELEKEYEGKPLEPEKETPAIQIDIPKERLEIPSRRKVFVHQIEIKGNESISTEEIMSWLKDELDKELSLHDIYELCHIIDQNYAQRGFFLARAYPPPQTIENGTLLIEVIEGKLGNVQVIGNNYYTESFVRSYFISLQHKP